MVYYQQFRIGTLLPLLFTAVYCQYIVISTLLTPFACDFIENSILIKYCNDFDHFYSYLLPCFLFCLGYGLKQYEPKKAPRLLFCKGR